MAARKTKQPNLSVSAKLDYQQLFEYNPAALWVEDFSAVKQAVLDVQTRGVGNFRTYLSEHPEFVRACVEKITLLDVNRAALPFYETGSKKESISGLREIFDDFSYSGFTEELLAISENRLEGVYPVLGANLKNKQVDIILRLTVLGGYEESLACVLIEVEDITDRKLTETLLHDTEYYYRMLIEQMSAVVYLLDEEGHLEYLSPQITSMLGYTPDELIGKADYLQMIVHPEDFERVALESHLAYETGTTFKSEYRLVSRAGETIWIYNIADRIYDPDGKSSGWHGLFYDIDDRKSIDAALVDSENRYHTLFDDSPIANWVIDASIVSRMIDELLQQGIRDLRRYFDQHSDLLLSVLKELTFIDINQSGLRMFGMQNKEELFISYNKAFLPQTYETFKQILSDIARGKENSYETRFQNFSGQLIDVLMHISIAHGHERDLSRVIVSIVDITAKIRAEEKLRAAETHYRTLIEQISAIVYIDNASDHKVRKYISPQAQFLLGITPELWMKDPYAWSKLIHSDDVVRVLEERNRAIVTGETFRMEYRMMSLDGEVIWIYDVADLVRAPDGSPLSWHGVLYDITERKEAEEALRESETRYRAVSELISDYAYSLRVEPDQRLVREWDAGSVERITGIPAEEVEQNGLPFALSPQSLVSVEAYMKKVMNGEKTTMEMPIVAKDGAYRWVRVTHKPIWSAGQNRVVRIYGAVQDITERRLATEALSESNRELTVLVSELQQRNRETNLRNEMGDMLQNCLNLKEAYNVIAEYAQRLSSNLPGALMRFNNSKNQLEAVIQWGYESEEELVVPSDACWALRRGRIHMVADQGNRLRCQHHEHADPNDLYACVPMIAQGETIGVFHQHITSDKPPEYWEQAVKSLAEQISSALANLELREILRGQSIRDPLTNLFNRRYLEETLEREMRRAARHQRPLGILMLDIDHFKVFNDSYGHDAGDAVLQELGIYLSNNVRVDDIACRYGGEEFLIILPESTLPESERRAEQIREGVSGLRVRHLSRTLDNITTSVGVAAYPEHGQTLAELLRAADMALYRAKADGRNRVCVA